MNLRNARASTNIACLGAASPVMASLAGLCIAGLVFLQSAIANNVNLGYADEVLALDALLYVACMYLILWSGRTSSEARARRLFRVVDATFLFALTTMLLSAAYIVYWVF